MTATGTGGVAMPTEGDHMMPEMDEMDDMPPMDEGPEESELGLDDEMGMGDDLGEDMGEDMGESVDMDTLRRVLDDCCPDKTEMVMDAVQAELGGMGDEMGDDMGMGDDLGMGDDMMDEGGLGSAGMPEGDHMMPEEEDDLAECGTTMESKVAEIAGLITEDPDIFTRPSRRRR